MASEKPGTNTTDFYYDAFGRRPFMKQNGHAYGTLLYDPSGSEFLEEDTNNAEFDYVWMDGLPIATIATGTAAISALHTDAIGTVQRGTNSSKTIVWTCNYTPDGACTPTKSITMNLRLLGQIATPEIENYTNGFRTRYPGKFPGYFEPDPLGLTAGLNRYVFAGNNPVTYTDRLGLFPDPFELAGGAAIGGFAGYKAPAKNATNRAIDTVIGAAAGGLAAAVSPILSNAAGNGAAGFFTAEAVSGGFAVSAGVSINYVNGEALQNDLGYALLIGVGAPILSGESLLIGSGYLEGDIGAARALALNSGVFTSIGILADQTVHAQGADNGLAGPPGFYGGGILLDRKPTGGSACQVSNPNVRSRMQSNDPLIFKQKRWGVITYDLSVFLATVTCIWLNIYSFFFYKVDDVVTGRVIT